MKRNEESVHTRISWIITLLAVLIQFYLYFKYLGSTSGYEETFKYISLAEGLFALSGLLLLDPINGRGFSLKPKKFKPLKLDTVSNALIMFIGIVIIQVTIQYIPLTVDDPDIALSIVFAAPSEENFFRGVFLSGFIIILSNKEPLIKIPLLKKKLSLWVLIGIIASAVAFAALHINYYENTQFLIGIFIIGIWLGFCYWYFEDLTALILAHFLLNFIVVWQTILVVSF